MSRTLFLKILAAYFLLNLIVIGVGGDFPLNDEWMYGLEVQKMLETGSLHLYGGSPACAAHVIVGALVCNFTGFSFATLRACSLAFGFLGCVLLYGVLRQLNVHRREATLAAFVLASSPLYVNLSFCYMTDVPAICYTLMYMMLVIAGLKRNDWRFFVAAALPLLIGIAVRQNSALLAFSNAILALMVYKRSRSSSLAIMLALVAAPMGWAYGMDKLMTFVNEYPSAYDWYKREISRLLNLAVHDTYAFSFLEAVSTVRAGAYLGLFCWPLLAGFFAPSIWLKIRSIESQNLRETSQPSKTALVREAISSHTETASGGSAEEEETTEPSLSKIKFDPSHATNEDVETNGRNAADIEFRPSYASAWNVVRADVAGYAFGALLVTLAGIAILVFFQQKLMPFSPNLLQVPELGPNTIIFARHAHKSLLIALTAISAWVAYILIFTLACSTHRTVLLCIRDWKRRDVMHNRDLTCLFVMLVCGLSFAWSVFHSTIANLDRYFVGPLVFVIPCVLMSARWLKLRVTTPVAVLVAILIATYSTCAEHDYLAWNRARWQAIADLESAGITHNQIDGGIEYNYSRSPALSNDLQLTANTFKSIHRGGAVTSTMRWWSVDGERFIITRQPIPGYSTEREYPYFSILSGRTSKMLVQRAQ